MQLNFECNADLSDQTTGAIYCSSQIQFYVDQPLSCVPTYGGINAYGSGQVNVPSGSVYAPSFVSQTIIQQFVTVYNININTVVINVNQITNKTVINNIINVLPPSVSPFSLVPTKASH